MGAYRRFRWPRRADPRQVPARAYLTGISSADVSNGGFGSAAVLGQ